MLEVENFVIRGYDKVIEYYRWMHDTASDSDRVVFQHRMEEVRAERDRYVAEVRNGIPIAA